MKQWNIRTAGAALIAAGWIAITAFAWFSPAKAISETERRELAQLPELSADALWNGRFMGSFETYTLDQFPLRDGFRRVKALMHKYALGQKDNNGIYVAEGYAAEMLYPMDEQALASNLSKLQRLYEKYLAESDCKIYASFIPDKNFYLGPDNGYLTMDYDRFFALVQEAMPWANYVNLTESLSLEDYYRTDIHWRQENLFPAARKLALALGVTAPKEEDFTQTVVERPFYGVYYGQAALPMDADDMVLLESDLLMDCTVYDHESGKTTAIYNMDNLTAKDLYDVYLSGPRSLLTIENPHAKTNRELVIIRDSFTSSMAPLLLQDYAKVTLVDIRYISTELLGSFLTFTDQDVLFLYSTKVLNTEGILK